VVGRQLNVPFVQGTYPAAAERRDEEAQLEDHVLPRPRLELFRHERRATDVIGREQDDGEPNRRMRLEFLDNRAALIGLLVKDDRLQTEPLQQTGNPLPRLILPMDDKNRVWIGLRPA